MKRSPSSPSPSPSPSPSSSSSSSCVVGSDNIVPHPDDDQIIHKKHNIKRPRKNQPNNKAKCLQNQKNNTSSTTVSSSRRSSIYRGVTRHRWTGRFEAHLWDKSSWNNIQNKKGKQVYLGAYDSEEGAARTYDLAALKYWGSDTILNFPIETYKKDVEEMQKVSKEEYLATLRRSSSGFSRGVSKYRGVARHHHNGRWEARIGRVFGNKYLYLGTYETQEEAAAAYDMAAIEYRGVNAVTNFDISHYVTRLNNKKGMFILDQNQDPLPNSPTVSAEIKVKQPRPEPEPERRQQQTQPTLLPLQEEIVSPHHQVLQYTQQQQQQLPSAMDTTNCEMADEHELTWSFCLDSTVGLTPLPVPHISFGNAGELPDLLDDMGFEDNIDVIFDAELEVVPNNGNEDDDDKYRECVLCPGNMEEEEEEDQKLVVSRLSSSSSSNTPSPSSSTATTLVSCNYCV